MKYPKINTIWKRDQKTGKIIEGDYAREEFANIRKWLVTEKIDGTNIRVFFNPITGTVRFAGRTDEAQTPPHLLAALQTIFAPDILAITFPDTPERPRPESVILFGEGYGPKIQKGGGDYRADAGFILFDAWIDGWWLEWESVEEIATKLHIPIVPKIGIMSLSDAIAYVKTTPKSNVAIKEKVAEGVVCRAYPLMLFRDGTPIFCKLKVRDFNGG